MKKNTNLTNIIRRTVREISKLRFSFLTKKEDVKIIDYSDNKNKMSKNELNKNNNLIFGELTHSAEIQINMSDLVIEFKCFYSGETEKKMIRAQYGDIDIADDEAQTFLAEFCNLVAGSLKNILQDSFECLKCQKNHLTIPKVVDNINFNDFIPEKMKNDSWLLKCEDYFIVCSIVIQFKKAKTISIINHEIKNKEAEIVFSDNGGEIIYTNKYINKN
ncbi:MAG: hypothetical protein HQK51_11095 [Oligoflexia bacterium]|nr:hypothetical protein [Oligoflexia bacterium]